MIIKFITALSITLSMIGLLYFVMQIVANIAHLIS